MPFSLRELHENLLSRNVLLGYLAVTTICVIVGPFYTEVSLPLPGQVAYWFGLNAAIFFVAGIILLGILRNQYLVGIPRLIRLGLGAIVIALAAGGLVHAANGLASGTGTNLPNYLQILAVSLPIAIAVTGILAIRVANSPDFPDPGSSLFFRRLPGFLGKNLLCLSHQDDYVEVVTEEGSHLILMPFSDALDELQNFDGLRIHRSYWVARSAVTDANTRNDTMFLRLRNGMELPVSRTYLPDVRKVLQL